MTMRVATVLWIAAAAVLLGPDAARASERVLLHTADGVALAGSYSAPARTPAPGIVLVHMLRRSSADWAPLVDPLREAGFAVLAIDLRGHGQSSGGIDPAGDLTALVQDVKAAAEWLEGRPDVLGSRIGMAGASVGANLVVMAAAANPSVRSIALLSAGLDYRGLRCEAAFKKYAERPALVLAGSDDFYAVRSGRELAADGPNARVEVLPDAGHGTVMLSRAPGLVAQLVDWFRSTLLS